MAPETAISDPITIKDSYELPDEFDSWTAVSSCSTDDFFSVNLTAVASQALSQLNAIKQLPDDWDSYGSPQLSEEVYSSAQKLIGLIQDAFVSQAPDVVPVSGGGVQFEWQYRGCELEIEFSSPFEVAYLKVFEDESMEEGVFSIEEMETEVRKLLSWLFA